jgi:hypothetical protein
MDSIKKRFILNLQAEGRDAEYIEDALVSMNLAKSYAQARRLITLANK